MDKILFLVLSALAIFCALGVVYSKNPVYSVLFMVMTFFSIAAHFVLLNAQFLAIVNVIVYAGAIVVLFLFVLMLLNLNKDAEPQKPFYLKLAGSVAAGLLLITLVGAIKSTDPSVADTLVGSDIGSVEVLGLTLFNNFILPFEIASVLFLSAMIGAVMLGKRDLKDN
jgi:NADH-quinone oxidoreductase subunit J